MASSCPQMNHGGQKNEKQYLINNEIFESSVFNLFLPEKRENSEKRRDCKCGSSRKPVKQDAQTFSDNSRQPFGDKADQYEECGGAENIRNNLMNF